MEDRRRTRSQGPPSLSEDNELIQWDSLPNPVRIEREHAEAHRLARQADTAVRVRENMVEISEILQVRSIEHQHPKNELQTSEILP